MAPFSEALCFRMEEGRLPKNRGRGLETPVRRKSAPGISEDLSPGEDTSATSERAAYSYCMEECLAGRRLEGPRSLSERSI